MGSSNSASTNKKTDTQCIGQNLELLQQDVDPLIIINFASTMIHSTRRIVRYPWRPVGRRRIIFEEDDPPSSPLLLLLPLPLEQQPQNSSSRSSSWLAAGRSTGRWRGATMGGEEMRGRCWIGRGRGGQRKGGGGGQRGGGKLGLGGVLPSWATKAGPQMGFCPKAGSPGPILPKFLISYLIFSPIYIILSKLYCIYHEYSGSYKISVSESYSPLIDIRGITFYPP